MKQRTDKTVYIPQLHVKRTIYMEDGHRYIMMEKDWVEMDGYKRMLKDIYVQVRVHKVTCSFTKINTARDMGALEGSARYINRSCYCCRGGI